MSDKPFIERRRFVRASFPCKIVVFTPQEHAISTQTENIGAGGIRVIIDEEIKVSSAVGLEIHLPQDQIICRGKVVWVVEKPNTYQEAASCYDTGVEFTEIKKEDQRIIDGFVKKIVSKE